ncbi:MAG: bi-domain-containing oxidoreductase [Saprospiraceae bacterium]|nr:bi-domain-containing oxidoreductase [Saprospiraceae bacterium]
MKQIIQHLKTGQTELADVPTPMIRPGHLLIRSTRSLVSLGTERMLVEFGKASLIAKARQQPDRVKQVLDKMRTDGIMPTLEAVFNKLDTPLPLGYCNVGIVEEIGAGVQGFKIGDRVASNGQHAEFNCVPQNLVAKIPEAVTDDEAVFTVISAIGLQGIRLFEPSFGETVCVIGLGLIGQITAQLLRANGCRVIGVDLDPDKLALAEKFGVIPVHAGQTDPVVFGQELTGGAGVDGVIITASAKDSSIISQAANMCRKRGRIILVGVVGLEMDRAEFYQKELSFQVSCSYGPGRYDDAYELRGQDYPLPYVRWTEKRNFEAILHALASGDLDVKPLITEVVGLEQFDQIYEDMKKKGSIASILKYSDAASTDRRVQLSTRSYSGGSSIGIIGAGNFTRMALLPFMKKANAPIKSIASSGGLNATMLARKHNIPESTSDYKTILNDPEIGLVVVTTRPDSHASMVLEGLKAGKDVFVEKPLAIFPEELEAIEKAAANSSNVVTVGYNRRFSPHTQAVKKQLDPNAPKYLIANMNAGFIPPELWIHDRNIGGGRILGEACHLIDLLSHLSGSPVRRVFMSALGNNPTESTDTACIQLKFANGDVGVVNYFANGSSQYGKERVEVHSQGKSLIIDNFRQTKGYGTSGFKGLKTQIDKGHLSQFKELVNHWQSGKTGLIPLEELLNVSKAAFGALESMKTGTWEDIA